MCLEEVCQRLTGILSTKAREAFNKDFSQILAARDQEFWLLGIDSKNKRYIDVCGNIGPDLTAAIRARGFWNTDAGYRADAQNVLPLQTRRADIFLLNTDHFSAPLEKLEPLVVHELAHLLEHIGEEPEPEGDDEANAEAILTSMHPNVLQLHSKEWALHLAGGGRMLVSKKLTLHKTVRAFLEAAVPSYDRLGPINAKMEP